MGFEESFYAGITKAEQVQQSRSKALEKIDKVFIKLNSEIQSTTKNLISIHYERNKNIGYDIVAKKTNGTNDKKILGSIWLDRYSGYLCKLSFSKKSFDCYDESALMNDLCSMLEDINISDRLLCLLQDNKDVGWHYR